MRRSGNYGAICIAALLWGAAASASESQDPRQRLKDFAAKESLSADLIERLYATIGRVECPGTKHSNGSIATGSVVLRADLILTTAHTFIDDKGRYREPLSKCFFWTFAKPDQKHFIDFTSTETRLPAEYGKVITSAGEEASDWAIVKLKAAVANARPFRVAASRPSRYEEILIVSAGEKAVRPTDWPGDWFKYNDLIARKAMILAVSYPVAFTSEGEVGGTIHTSARGAPGASGSALLRFDGGNDPEVVGVNVGYDFSAAYAPGVTAAPSAAVVQIQMLPASQRKFGR